MPANIKNFVHPSCKPLNTFVVKIFNTKDARRDALSNTMKYNST